MNSKHIIFPSVFLLGIISMYISVILLLEAYSNLTNLNKATINKARRLMLASIILSCIGIFTFIFFKVNYSN